MRYHLLIPADIAARGSRCDKTAHRDITVPNRGAAYKTVIHLLYLPPLSPAGTSLKTRCKRYFFLLKRSAEIFLVFNYYIYLSVHCQVLLCDRYQNRTRNFQNTLLFNYKNTFIIGL